MKPFKFSKKNREYIKWDKNTKEVRIVTETRQSGEKTPSLQIDIDDITAQGIYANMAAVTHTETEFIIDFLFHMANQPKAGVRARIISTPLHTKRLCAALRENIKQYENRFGPIRD